MDFSSCPDEKTTLINNLCKLAVEAVRLSRGKRLHIWYRKETEESWQAFDEFKRAMHGIYPGGEFIYVFDEDGHLLYAVDVTSDSPLTAFAELTSLLARKF